MAPTASPWLRILGRCTASSGGAVIVIALLSLFFAGTPGLFSSIFGGALVMLFFTISLIIGHFFSAKNPTGTLAIFAVTYVVKFIGFAAALILIGTPGWLARLWFFLAAVVAVLIWQCVELLVFSKARLLAFPASEETSETSKAAHHG